MFRMIEEELEQIRKTREQLKTSRSYTEPTNGTKSEDLFRQKMKGLQEIANIPSGYKDCRLNNFTTAYYSDNTKVQLMISKVKEWWADFQSNYDKGKGLYIYSETRGSGKTRLAISILNEIFSDYEKRALFTTSVQILNEIRSSWDDGKVSESNLLDRLVKAPVLVIDDFGTEQIKDWVEERFYFIINERYNWRRMTLYTSNLPMERLGYDERITERIYERSEGVPFPEENIRRKIRDQKGQGS